MALRLFRQRGLPRFTPYGRPSASDKEFRL